MSNVTDKERNTTRKRKPKTGKQPDKLTPEQVAARKAAREKAQINKIAKAYSWKLDMQAGARIAFIVLLVVLVSPLWSVLFDRPDFNITNAQNKVVVQTDDLSLRLRRLDAQTLQEPGRSGSISKVEATGKRTLRAGAGFAGADGLTWLLFQSHGGNGEPLQRYTDTPAGAPIEFVRGAPDSTRTYRDVQLSYPTLFGGSEDLIALTDKKEFTKLTISLVETDAYYASPQKLDYMAPPGTYMIVGWQGPNGTGASLQENTRRTLIYSLAGPPHFLMGIGMGLLIILAFTRFIASYHQFGAAIVAPSLKYHEQAAFALICLTAFSFVLWQITRHLSLWI